MNNHSRCCLASLAVINTLVLEKKIVEIRQRFFANSGWFVPGLIRITPVVLEKKYENVKIFRQTDKWTYYRQSENLSLQLR